MTRTRTVPTPLSSIRSVTRGGRPAGEVLGTLSRLTTGRRAVAARVETPYSMPPVSRADRACGPADGARAPPGSGARDEGACTARVPLWCTALPCAEAVGASSAIAVSAEHTAVLVYLIPIYRQAGVAAQHVCHDLQAQTR